MLDHFLLGLFIGLGWWVSKLPASLFKLLLLVLNGYLDDEDEDERRPSLRDDE